MLTRGYTVGTHDLKETIIWNPAIRVQYASDFACKATTIGATVQQSAGRNGVVFVDDSDA